MKVLFLDVDGVLNSLSNPGGIKGVSGHFGMAQEYVDRLLSIVYRTGCLVVVSSAWRHKTIDQTLAGAFGETLRRRNGDAILGAVVGVTPDFPGAGRGAEISDWLSGHPDVTSYAIVDDDPVAGHGGRLFQTDFTTGLTQDVADQIIQHLGEAND